jgi:hypothetical protein
LVKTYGPLTAGQLVKLLGRESLAAITGPLLLGAFTGRGWYDSQLLGRESLAAVADQRAQLVKESRQLVKLNAQNPRPAGEGIAPAGKKK